MSTAVVPDSAIVVVARDVLATEFTDEFVILNPRDGVYYGLEAVGARIWTLLQSPVSVWTIRDALMAEYEVDAARCLQDLRSLLGELVSHGLVEQRESS